MNEPCLLLKGLDASNPLAYMAGLGVLQSLSDFESMTGAKHSWRLSWRNQGQWIAVLHGSDDAGFVIERLQASAELWSDEPALRLAYDADGKLAPVGGNGRDTFDLKPATDAFRAYSQEVAGTSAPRRLRSVRQIAAYGSELITDNNGRLKPTAMHFTAGQQAFLEMVRRLQSGVSASDFEEALFGPWKNTSKLPSLSWNASAPRIYAYRAGNPAAEKRGSVPAADWLAFVALGFFPVAADRSRLVTAGVRGGWKGSVFRWPVWEHPLRVQSVRSVLTWNGLWEINRRQALAAAGIALVYESKILRSDQGGYGSFSPAGML